ncbi:GGDEF domain-containing protein [Bacillus sp. NP157]|nr:GGDEF domain-containing protein [Bacillus sp. NP157]
MVSVLPIRRIGRVAVALGLMLCVACPAVDAAGLVPATAGTAGPSQRLVQVNAIRTKDHPRFVEQLAELHRDEASLGPADRWYLRFLDGWQVNWDGGYPEAEAILRDVMAHADSDVLRTRATALLMNNLSAQGKYADAYAISTRAVESLPHVTDPDARFGLLANLSLMLTFAGQPELGLKYADMMLRATPPGESACQAMVQRVTALEGSRRLTSNSPDLLRTIDICMADRQLVFTNTMELVLVDRLLDEHKLTEALAANQRLAPAVKATEYFPHIVALSSQRARIYEQMGDLVQARKAALDAVALSHPGDMNESLRFAYRILYTIDKAKGHAASALDYYEHYVVQDLGYLRDSDVRNAAYQASSQHFVAEKLEAEGLSKENRILRLQQALDSKAVETSRLYILMMALVLLSIVFWLVRIKRSQLRFKRLSSYDGLTATFHHQHFLSEADRALRFLEKRSGEACLVFLDLDHFKQVNDMHGHAVGDAVLKHAVAIFREQLRKADLLGRLGGEEFGMLLMDTSRRQGGIVAERIRTALEASPLGVEGAFVNITASIGVASVDGVGYDVQRLCRAADAALYEAKHRGRNRVVVDDGDGLALVVL